jgi:hypothetical protein
MTNSFFVMPTPTFNRGDSYLVMPPPMATHRRCQQQPCKEPQETMSTENTKDIAFKSLPLVSPDLPATIACDEVPCLILGDEDLSESPGLSADQCADILDDVFGHIDISLFSSSSDDINNRPAKKTKIME